MTKVPQRHLMTGGDDGGGDDGGGDDGGGDDGN